MYDRKTWLVVIGCSVLLALNVYYTGKNRADLAPAPAAQTSSATPASPAVPGTPAVPAAEKALTVDPPPAQEEKTVTLETDKVVFTFTTAGGGIKYADFKEQFQVGSKHDPVRINRFGAGPIGAIADASNGGLDNLSYAYDTAGSIPGKKVALIGSHPSGLVVKKIFSLIETGKPGTPYLLDLDVQVQNTSAQPIALNNYSLFIGESSPLHQKEPPSSYFWHHGGESDFKDASAFNGGFFGSAQSMLDVKGDKMEFGGVADQFFATVLRPKDVQAGRLWAKYSEVMLPNADKAVRSVNAGLNFPVVTLAPNEQKAIGYSVFVGPRHNAMLRQMGDSWGDLMPYGWFWWVSNPLNRLLNWLHEAFKGTGSQWSWGLAIIAMTLIVRAAIWPLYAKSTRSMKRMSKLQPEMTKLKEKYPDDPNRMNQEMMKLYRTYGVNPIGGCLPMLIQIPIFLGFFRVLQFAVELRGQGFLWVNDLSQPDTQWVIPVPFFNTHIPVNPLPIVMAVTSFIQMAMTPKTGDKTQQRIIMMMPFMFFFFCYNFAAALALYWTTTNIFSIVQTWITNKLPEPELKEKKNASGKKTWVERMAEKQQEMQRSQQMRQVGPNPPEDDAPKKKRTPRTGG